MQLFLEHRNLRQFLIDRFPVVVRTERHTPTDKDKTLFRHFARVRVLEFSVLTRIQRSEKSQFTSAKLEMLLEVCQD